MSTAVGAPERIDHDALDVRLHCGYSNDMNSATTFRVDTSNIAKKTMKAKYPGKCSECGATFPAGTEIYWTGSAAHKECAEKAVADLAAEDAANSARMAKEMADYKAGEMVKSTILGTEKLEIMVTGAPNAEMARAEANAVVASIRAAGGKAKLLGHTKNGKRYVGREIVHYYGMSTMGHHEGWAYRVWIDRPEAAVA